MSDRPHDAALRTAFDAQAERFERSPVQSDRAALARIVAFAGLPPGARVLDAGCGPGLVAEAFLEAGAEVHGVDLSEEMIRRARARCARFGDRARFEIGSLLDLPAAPAYDGAVSRHVLHHVEDPRAFLAREAALLRAGGTLLAVDHTGDPDPARAAWHQGIERARDRTHVRNLSPGELLDLLGAAGLVELRHAEEPFDLDFDEWFDRGSSGEPKEAVRARLLAGASRGFTPEPLAGGRIAIHSWRSLVAGRRP